MPVVPFIPFANCAEVVCIGTFGGTACYLTNGVRKGSPFSGTDLTDIGNIFGLWLQEDLLPLLYNTLTYTQIKVTDLTSQFAPIAIATDGLPASGAVTGASVTNQVASVVSFKTGLRGRSFRGRNYVGGLGATALNTTTTVSAAFAASLVGAYVQLATSLGAAGFDHVVLSRFENNVRRSVGVATRITDYIGRLPLGTQRRRIVGHGI